MEFCHGKDKSTIDFDHPFMFVFIFISVSTVGLKQITWEMNRERLLVHYFLHWLIYMILGILSTFLSIPSSLIMYNVLLMIIVANQKKEKEGVGGPFVGKLIGSS